jgi:hypothetical protein
MENIFLRYAGLDVHKASVEACVPRMEPSGHVHQQTRHWGTMTRDIGMMADWMVAQGVTPIALESGSVASEVMGVSGSCHDSGSAGR